MFQPPSINRPSVYLWIQLTACQADANTGPRRQRRVGSNSFGRPNPVPLCNVELQKAMAPEDVQSMPIPDFERTAIAVAAKLGIVSDAPIVLAEGMTTVVHLRPSPIVGRVTRLTHLVRPVDGVTGTIALARALPGLVVPPTDRIDPGPHVAEGRYVT